MCVSVCDLCASVDVCIHGCMAKIIFMCVFLGFRNLLKISVKHDFEMDKGNFPAEIHGQL